MSDLISRAEAIKVLKSNYDLLEGATLRTDKARRDEISAMMAKIMSLPSAKPKTGEWVLDPNGMDWNIPAWRCSECGFVANYIGVEANGLGNNPMNWAGSKFCPQCGARITGYER